MKNEENMSYEQALAELRKIVDVISLDQTPLSEVEKEMKRANYLLKYCKSKIEGYKEGFDEILNEVNNDF